ncbi:MAG: 6-bladed beta-propeller [Candidatus Aegiribacteria sp.]|nr:6-bladed beta-propeller [Candidatus Aegiribacteria sp.]
MVILRIIFMVFMIIATLSGCDRNAPYDTEVTEAHRTERELVPFDSIGIEMGDSNYVFGIPRALEFTSLGNIVVGDISKMKLLMYSPDGMFIRRGGSEGQGPGEYTAPTGISSTRSGGIMVADAMGGKLIFYDSLLSYTHELAGFTPRPPESPEIQIDGGIVGRSFVFDQETGSLCNSLNRWEPGETETSFSYLERSSDFDQQNPRKVFQETGINFCTLQDGRVIASPLSTEEYTLICFSTEGEVEWEIHPHFERQRRSEEDIEIEREMIRAAMRRNGRDPSYVDQMKFQEWSNAVTNLYTQGNRIWARRGGSLEPLFDIYSTDGEYLYSCSVPSLPYGSSIGFAISPYSSNILAYMANPEDYSRIWMLREEDRITGESFEDTSEVY